MTCVNPSASMSIGTPSTGEVSAPGLPGDAEWSWVAAPSPGTHPASATTTSAARAIARGRAQGHAGARPVPLLPGLTAGSPAAHRGQSTPASYVGRSSAHSARSG